MGKAGVGKTIPSQFRLAEDVLTALDRIAEKLSEDGVPHSRTDAVRKSVAIASRQLGIDLAAPNDLGADARTAEKPASPPPAAKKPRKKS